jgi:CheY-like chemotaxis protein
MEQLRILAAGKNKDIMTVINRLINTHENWSGVTVTSNDEAIDTAKEVKYDLLLICAGFSSAEEKELTDELQTLQPNLRVLRHYGGGSGLLESEIRSYLKTI